MLIAKMIVSQAEPVKPSYRCHAGDDIVWSET